MGQNKALMKLNGCEIIERIVHTLTPISEEMLIVTNSPDTYQHLGTKVINDEQEFKGKGPLAGLLTGIAAAKTDSCLVVACDMPFVSANVANWLVHLLKERNYDAIIPVDQGKQHFLFGAYSGRAQIAARENLQAGKKAMKSLFDKIKVQLVYKDDAPPEVQEEWEACFWNMNTVEDYHRAKEIARQL
jgi:molybdopterin-guanine dinucleotide biosynthesis protein A